MNKVSEGCLALDRGDLERASLLINEALYNHPDDHKALLAQARVLVSGRMHGTARAVALYAAQISDVGKEWQYHRMMGAMEQQLQRFDSAKHHLELAHEMAPEDITTKQFLCTLAMETGRIEEGETYADEIIRLDPFNWQAKTAKGFALLHRRHWGPGWDYYQHGLGRLDWRTKHDYGIPDWDGSPGATLLAYPEQGVGDQIVWCSAVDDLPITQLCTHPKLEGLMARTFPNVEVHGSQFEEPVKWKPTATHQVSMGTMMRWCRRTPESWPGNRYLKPCPERKLQWNATLEHMCKQPFQRPWKPRIGIAWTGGALMSYGSKERDIQPEDWAPIMNGVDAHWIAIEYKENPDLDRFPKKPLWFPRATVTDDLDDFAALVANLDAVICVPTAAYHVAGALGVPAYVIVHETPHYHEGISGGCPYWNSVEFFRRSELGLTGAMEAIVERLSIWRYQTLAI